MIIIGSNYSLSKNNYIVYIKKIIGVKVEKEKKGGNFCTYTRNISN